MISNSLVTQFWLLSHPVSYFPGHVFLCSRRFSGLPGMIESHHWHWARYASVNADLASFEAFPVCWPVVVHKLLCSFFILITWPRNWTSGDGLHIYRLLISRCGLTLSFCRRKWECLLGWRDSSFPHVVPAHNHYGRFVDVDKVPNYLPSNEFPLKSLKIY